jgi:hypothetical protein
MKYKHPKLLVENLSGRNKIELRVRLRDCATVGYVAAVTEHASEDLLQDMDYLGRMLKSLLIAACDRWDCNANLIKEIKEK